MSAVIPSPLDPALWLTLVSVNDQVNRLPYRTDAELYGRTDFWTEISARGGDCEDFAIGKRNRLQVLGWPPKLLSLATCWTEDDQRHAVLCVDTTAGTYVLDNRYGAPMPWADLPYRWDRRQKAGGAEWVAIDA